MSRKKSLGMSLVELMIAMAIGLVVIGSVLAFTLSSLTSNTEYVQATRLSQELRNSMDFVSRELRRSGYDQNTGSKIASLTTSSTNIASPFARISIKDVSPLVVIGTPSTAVNADDDGCVIYAYDRNDNGVGTPGVVDLDNGEIRALRLATRTVDGLSVGVLEMAESFSATSPDCGADGPNYTNYPPSRNATTGWSALSDPRLLNLTAFRLENTGYLNIPVSATSAPITMREIGIELQGQLRRSEDGTITRGIRSNVRIRADCLDSVANCALAPTGT